ncbi:carbonic anhydrase [Trichoderma evansii]
MPPASIDTLIKRNREYSKHHVPGLTIEELQAAGDDSQRTIVITCTDNRINPEQFLQTKPQDGVVICRNPGGRTATALTSIMLYDAFVKVQDIIVIHHTGCGCLYFTEEDLRKVHKGRLPDHPEIDDMVFGAFSDVEQSVRDDLEFLKTSPYIPKALAERSYGYVFDLKTGLLSPVA